MSMTVQTNLIPPIQSNLPTFTAQIQSNVTTNIHQLLVSIYNQDTMGDYVLEPSCSFEMILNITIAPQSQTQVTLNYPNIPTANRFLGILGVAWNNMNCDVVGEAFIPLSNIPINGV